MPSADKGAVPKAAAAGTGGQAAAPQQVHAGTGGQAAAPQHVHAGTGGQASEGSSSTPLAPLGFVLAGAAVVAMAGRRLHRG
jgi:hypothetical protein